MITYFYPPQPTRIWPTSPLLRSLSGNKAWDAEIKYNGWRTLIFKHTPDSIFIYNRHGTIIDIDWKPFWHSFAAIPTNTVFDGELLDRRTKDLKNVIVLWDVPWFAGKDLRSKPLADRRPLLDVFDIAPAQFETERTGQVYRVQQFSSDFVELYHSIEGRDDPVEEGLVLKKKSSTYRSHPGRGIDILDWLKVKKIGEHARATKDT